MDDQLVAFGDEHNDFEKVAGTVGTDDQPPVGILAKVVDDRRMLDGVKEVVICDSMSACGREDLHTSILYYESVGASAIARLVRCAPRPSTRAPPPTLTIRQRRAASGTGPALRSTGLEHSATALDCGSVLDVTLEFDQVSGRHSTASRTSDVFGRATM